MKPTTECLEVISPKVQISESFIETDYDYQTSHVKRTANGKIQVSFSINFIYYIQQIFLMVKSKMNIPPDS